MSVLEKLRATLAKGMGHIAATKRIAFASFSGKPVLKNKEGQSATVICPVCGAEIEEIGWWCPCFDDRPDSYPRDIEDIL
jgi:hypothetical protein